MGVSVPRPNARDIVTGAHKYPSDITLPGMFHGKVLRAPSYGAKLVSIDLAPAKAMKDVVAVEDDQFVGVAAPTTHQARKALEAIAPTAKWELAAATLKPGDIRLSAQARARRGAEKSLCRGTGQCRQSSQADL